MAKERILCVGYNRRNETLKKPLPLAHSIGFTPITAKCITNEFPGHAIYRTPDLLTSQPLLHNEDLHEGELYYLLPNNNTFVKQNDDQNNINISSSSSSMNTLYRMSFDQHRVWKRTEATEVLPRYNSSGVWKVKLVISRDQLAEILAQESRTEALIESVRTVAKCGNGVSSSIASVLLGQIGGQSQRLTWPINFIPVTKNMVKNVAT